VAADEEDLKPVMLPSGGSFTVYKVEVQFFRERVRKYTEDNHFTNVADLATLDQLIILEVLHWRYSRWVAEQQDYWGEPVPEQAIGRQMNDISKEARALRQSLNIDKASRDKARQEAEVAEYIENLRIRAKEFGVHREEQLGNALQLMNEIIAQVTLWDNCNDAERRRQHCTSDEVLAWMRDDVGPRYEAVDEHFRQNQQRFWVREL
jgi:hypothetical protein